MSIPKIAFIAITAAISFGLTSCHSSKKSVSNNNGYDEQRSETRVKSLPSELKAMTETYYDWVDVQVPVKIQIIQPKRTSVSGVAKMRKGESIHISIRVFGFEVGSLYADKEAVQVYIKAMDMYWTEPLSVLTERYGLTLTDLQSLLLGQPFLPGSGTISASDVNKFNINKDRDIADNGIVFNFTPKKLPENITWTYSATALPESAPFLSSMTITPGTFSPFNCSFGKPAVSPAGAVSSGFEIGTDFNGKEFQASWNWSFDSSKWNSGLRITKPAVSKSARKVETPQLFKTLKSL